MKSISKVFQFMFIYLFVGLYSTYAQDHMPLMNSNGNQLTNEYLSKANEKKTKLLLAYEQYSAALEDMLSSVFDIQKDLKEILKEQSSLIPNPPKKQPKTTKKSKKK